MRLAWLLLLAAIACDGGQKPRPPAPPPAPIRPTPIDAQVPDVATSPPRCRFYAVESPEEGEACDVATCKRLRGPDASCPEPFHCAVVRDARDEITKICGAETIDCLEAEHLAIGLGGTALERCDGLALPVPKEPPQRYFHWCDAKRAYGCEATRALCEQSSGHRCVETAAVSCFVQSNPGLIRDHECFATMAACKAAWKDALARGGENEVLRGCSTSP